MTPAHDARQHAEHVPAAGGVRQPIEAFVPWYDLRIGTHCTHGSHVASHAHRRFRPPVTERRALLEAVRCVIVADDHRRKP